MNPTSIIILVFFILFWIISGILSMDLHDKKGYSGGFLVGFLLGYIGLIYSVGLPDARNKKLITDENKETIIVSEDEDEKIEEVNMPQSNECPNCLSKIEKDDTVCSNCGIRLK